MATSLFFQRERGRKDPTSSLPSFSGATKEKMHLSGRHSTSWFTPVFIKLPFLYDRRLRLYLPVPSQLHQHVISRYGRRRGTALLYLFIFFILWLLFVVARRFGSRSGSWTPPFLGDPPTLVYERDGLKRIWEWEIESGHYQSSRPIPLQVGLSDPPRNPGVPSSKIPIKGTLPNRFRSPSARTGGVEYSIGVGAERIYLDLQSRPPNVAYPPRPIPGSIADLDIIMDNCDFSKGKYVRDCLEVLRVGGGLDNGKRVRRGNMDRWKYIYREEEPFINDEAETQSFPPDPVRKLPKDDTQAGLVFRDKNWLESKLDLPPVAPYRSTAESPGRVCDPNHPKLFHMFWAGPFTDKPYLAILSFLFTQNTGLHHPAGTEADVCRPKFWLWINPGPAAAVSNPRALHDMYDNLALNPWSSPFLHPRFADVIEFKLWNTTEQLDGVPEIKDEWRSQRALFNSGGYKYAVNHAKGKESSKAEAQGQADSVDDDETKAADPSPTHAAQGGKNNMYEMVGSTSATDYDRLSVILSDMARFILCHRFGGTYLDADTILLRDWEELWGWKGAFAYRWSRLEKYNTAVLRMNKRSALGSFLFRTALRNELDFHPMTVSRYMKDAYLEGLLLRLPDALFDSAWLNTEDYQRDRPPFPYFTEFGDFFSTPRSSNAAPQALGFDGFFKGAYSYHFHNFWWKPFDPSRNWPDLGPIFSKGEQVAKAQLNITNMSPSHDSDGYAEDDVLVDQRDLDWAGVLKRTFEAYIRGERPNAYGEWLVW